MWTIAFVGLFIVAGVVALALLLLAAFWYGILDDALAPENERERRLCTGALPQNMGLANSLWGELHDSLHGERERSTMTKPDSSG